VDTHAKGMLCEQWVYNSTRTNQVDSRQRRVAPCDGVESPIEIMCGSDDERGIARAGVLRKRSCRVRVRGRRESKARQGGWGSTRWGPGCCCATRKAVIVDRIDYFLYFGAIMLYARWIAASLLMEDAVFASARVTVHNGNN